MMSWDWKPGISIGKLIFGGELHPDSLGVPIERLPPSHDEAEWETYRVGGEQGRISVEDGKIVSVECVESLRLHDNELLGLSISEVNRLLTKTAVLCEAYEDGDERWECEELGLILWVEDGVVASATVSSP